MSSLIESQGITNNTAPIPTAPTPTAGGTAINPAYQAQEDFQRASVRLRSQLDGLAGLASTDDLREELTDAIREVAEKLGEVECAVNEITANSLTAWVRGQFNAPPPLEADDAEVELVSIHRHIPANPTVAEAYASECEGLRLRIPNTPLRLYGGVGQFDYDDWTAMAGDLLYVLMTPAQAKVMGIAIEHAPEDTESDLEECGFHLPHVRPDGKAGA